MSSELSRRKEKKHRRRWIELFATLASFALMVGGVFWWQTATAPQSSAVPLTGTPVSNQGIVPDWKPVRGWNATWLQLLKEDNVYSAQYSTRYTAANAVAGQVIDPLLVELYDWEDDWSTYKTRAALTLTKTNDPRPDSFAVFSAIDTMAIGRIGGTKAHPEPDYPLTVYVWSSWGYSYGGSMNCPVLYTPVVRATSGQPEMQWACMPVPFDNDNGTSWAHMDGGQVDQYTGNIYTLSRVNESAENFSGNLLDNKDSDSADANTGTGYSFIVWNPTTGQYSVSNPVQPGDWRPGMDEPPQERSKVIGEGSSSGAADFTIDADGNCYLVMNGGYTSMAVVRVEPARDGAGNVVDGSADPDDLNPWRYYVVDQIGKQDRSQYWGAANSMMGPAILKGKLLMGGYGVSGVPLPPTATEGGQTTTAVVIDPLTQSAKVAWSTNNRDYLVTYVRNFVSPQPTFVVQGTLYEDANADGEITAGEPGLPGQTVALYAGDDHVLLSVQQTDSMGHYSFIVPPQAYTGFTLTADLNTTLLYVRPVDVGVPDSNTGDLVDAVQTWAAGSNDVGSDGLTNIAEARCGEGPIDQRAGGPCSGNPDFQGEEQPLGKWGDPSQIEDWAYAAKITLVTGQSVPTADFGFAANVSTTGIDPRQSSFSVDPPVDPTDANQTNWRFADGADHYTGVLIPRDSSGRIITELSDADLAALTFSASDPSVRISAPQRNSDGTYSVTYTIGADSSAWPSLTASVSYRGVSIDGNRPIPFRGMVISAARSSFAVTPVADPSDLGESNWRVADGVDHYVGTVTVRGDDGQLVTNQNDIAFDSFTFPVSSDGMAVSSPVWNGDGTFTVEITSTTPSPTSTVSARYAGRLVSGSYGTSPVPFSENIPDYSQTIFIAVPEVSSSDPLRTDWRRADGEDYYTGILTPRNRAGNLITDPSVLNPARWIFSSSSGVSVSAPQLNSDGTLSVAFTSTVASSSYTATVTYSSDTLLIFLGRAEIPFKSVGPDLSLSSFTVTPAVSAPDANQTDWRVADGSDSYTGTFTARGSDGLAVTDLDVGDLAFSASSPDVTVSAPVKNTDGTYSVTYTSTKASSAYTASLAYQGNSVGTARPIPFKPGPVSTTQSTFIVSPAVSASDSSQTNWRVANGSDSYTGTFTPRDAYGNLTTDVTGGMGFQVSSSYVTVSRIVKNTDGTYSATYTSTRAGSGYTTGMYYTPIDGRPTTVGSAQPIPFKAGGLSLAQSTFTVAPVVNASDSYQANWRVANGSDSYTGTFTPKDANGNLVTDSSAVVMGSLSFSVSSTDVAMTFPVKNSDGTYTVTYTSTTAGSGYTASLAYQGSAVGSAQPIPFKSGPLSSTQSSFAVSPVVDPSDANQTNWRVANGSDSYTGTLTAKDANGNPITNLTSYDIRFSASSGVSVSAVSTAGNGVYQVSFTSTTASSTPTASVTCQSTPVGGSLPIPFKAGGLSLAQSTFTVTPVASASDSSQANWRVANGSDAYAGVFTPKDANGNLVTDTSAVSVGSLSFTVSSSDVAVTAPVRNSDGTYTVTYTSTKASSGYTASLAYQGSAVGAARAIPFKPGPFSVAQSSFAVSPVVDPLDPDRTGWKAADGSEAYTGTLTAKDANGNLVTNLVLSNIVFSASSGVSVSSVANAGDGTYTVSFTSRVVSSTPTASVRYQGNQVGGNLPIPFTVGSFSTVFSTFGITPEVDPADPGQTSWRVADGDSAYVGVLTPRDSQGNVVTALPVAVLASLDFPAPSGVTVSSPVRQADGTYQVRYTSTVASSAPQAVVTYQGVQVGQSWPIPFKAGAFDAGESRFAVTPQADPGDPNTWVAAGGLGSYIAVLSARDANNNPISTLSLDDIIFLASSDDVTLTSVENTGAGTYTVSCSSMVGSADPMASVRYQGTQIGQALPIPFSAGEADPARFSFSVSPQADPNDAAQVGWVAADGVASYTATVTARDASGVALADLFASDFVFTASSPDVTISGVEYAGEGRYQVTATSTVGSSTTTMSASYQERKIGAEAPIPFAHAQLSASLSSVEVSPRVDPNDAAQVGWVAADGVGSYAVVLTARDAAGSALAGLSTDDVAFLPSSTDVRPSEMEYLGDGRYQMRFTSDVGSSTTTVSVSCSGELVGQALPIPFASGGVDAGVSTFQVTPRADLEDPSGWVVAGDGSYTGVFTAKDSAGNLLADLEDSLRFAVSSSDVTVSDATYVGQGRYQVSYTSQVGTKDVTAAVWYGATQVGEALPIPFAAGEASVGESSFQITPQVDMEDPSGWVHAGGGSYTGVFTAKDAAGNGLADLKDAVRFTASTDDVTISDVTYVGQGRYQVTYASRVGSKDATASVFLNGTQMGGPSPIPFGHGDVDDAVLTFSVTPQVDPTDAAQTGWVLADGVDSYTGVVTAVDAGGVPIGDLTLADIIITASSLDVTISDVEYSGGGHYTVTMASTVGSAATTVSASYRGNLVGADEPIPFASGGISVGESTFQVTPVVDPTDLAQTGWALADGVSAYTGVLTARDAQGRLLADLADSLRFAASSDVSVSDVAYVGEGRYQVTYTSLVGSAATVASAWFGAVQVGESLPIPFAAGEISGAESTFVIDPVVNPEDPAHAGWMAADGVSAYTGVVTARDSQGSLLAGLADSLRFVPSSPDVAVSGVAYLGEGRYQASFTSQVASKDFTASAWLGDTQVGTPLPIPFAAGGMSVGKSTFVIDPVVDPDDATHTGWAAADGVSSYTGVFTAKDANDSLLADLADSLRFVSSSSDVSVSETTYLGEGRYQVRFTSQAASKNATASAWLGDAQVGESLPIPFAGGEISIGGSTFAVTPQVDPADPAHTGWAAADGVSSYTGVFTAKDANGSLLADLAGSLRFVPSSDDVSVSAITYLGEGGYQARFTSLVASKDATVSVWLGETRVSDMLPIPFTAGEAAAGESTFAVTPQVDPADPAHAGWAAADGVSSYTGVLTARDANGSLLADLAGVVRFVPSSEDVSMSGVTYVGEGRYQVKFTSQVASSGFTVSAWLDDAQVGVPLPIPFAAGEVSADESTFQVDPAVDPTDGAQTGWPAADGVASYSGVVTARDADGSLLAGLAGALRFVPSSADVSVSEVTYLGEGRYQAKFTSLVGSASPTVSAWLGEVQVGGVLPIPFFIPAGEQARPSLTADTDTAVVGASITMTALVVNPIGAPVPGATVSFSTRSDEVRVIGETGSTRCVTGVDGTCSVGVTSDVPGTYTDEVSASVDVDGAATPLLGSPMTVKFTPAADPVVSTFEVAMTDESALVVPADGVSSWTGRFTAKDRQGNLLSGLNREDIVFTADGVRVTSVTDEGDGTYTVEFTSTTAGIFTASLTYRGQPVGGGEPIVFQNLTPAPAEVSVQVSPVSQTAGSPVTIAVSVLDGYGLPITGLDQFDFHVFGHADGLPDLAVTDFQQSDGVYTWSAVSLLAGRFAVSASVDGVVSVDDASATFTAGPVCVEECAPVDSEDVTQVTVTVNDRLADGTELDQVAVRAFDRYGNPVPGATVVPRLAEGSDGVSLDSPVAPTGADGTTSFAYSSTRAGAFDVDVTIGGATPDTSPVTVRFVATSPDLLLSRWTVEEHGPLTVGVGEESRYTASATLVDKDGRPVQGVVVSFALNGTGPVASPDSACETDQDGTCRVVWTSTVAGSFPLVATIDAGALTNGTSGGTAAMLVWTADEACLSATGCVPGVSVPAERRTRAEVTVDERAADGVGRNEVTARVFDQWGNPVGGVVVRTDAEPSVTSTGEEATDSDGSARFTYSSLVAGSHVVHVYVGTAEVPGSPLEVTFLGPPVILSPADGSELKESLVTITGTGQTDGDTILVSDSGVRMCATIVADGAWSCQVSLSDGSHTLTAVEQTPRGNDSPPASVTVVVDTAGPTTSPTPTPTGTPTGTPTSTPTGTPTPTETPTGTPTPTPTPTPTSTPTPTPTVTPTPTPTGTPTGTPTPPVTSVDPDRSLFEVVMTDPSASHVVANNSQSWTGRLTAKDDGGGLIEGLDPSDIHFTAAPDGVHVTEVTYEGGGTYTVRFTSSVPGNFIASLTVGAVRIGTGLPMVFELPTSTDVVASVSVSPSRQMVGSPVVVTVAVLDGDGVPISGLTASDVTVVGRGESVPDLALSGFQETAPGVYAWVATSTRIGDFEVSATVLGIDSRTNAQVSFVPATPDLIQSSWLLEEQGPLTVGNGAESGYTAVATILDGNGQPVSGVQVDFGIGGAGPVVIPGSSCATEADGTCRVSITSTVAGSFPVTATIAWGALTNVTSGDTVVMAVWTSEEICLQELGCEPGPSVPAEQRTHAVVTLDNQAADGGARNVVTVWAFDRWGNPVEGVVVRDDPDPSLVASGSIATGPDGAARFAYATTVEGSYQVRLSIDGRQVAGSPVEITFRAPSVIEPTGTPTGPTAPATPSVPPPTSSPGQPGTSIPTGGAAHGWSSALGLLAGLVVAMLGLRVGAGGTGTTARRELAGTRRTPRDG